MKRIIILMMIYKLTIHFFDKNIKIEYKSINKMKPSHILQIPDITRHITIFTDISTTFNLVKTNKILYFNITTDPRFILLKIFYIYYGHFIFVKPIDQTFINLMQTCKYMFYKIAQSEYLLHVRYPEVSLRTDFYRKLYNDKLISKPKYFNPIYSAGYYSLKYQYERSNGTRHEMKLNKLIKYYENPSYTIPVFPKFIESISKEKLLIFKNTNFAKKFGFYLLQYDTIHQTRLYINHIVFRYNSVDYEVTLYNRYTITNHIIIKSYVGNKSDQYALFQVKITKNMTNYFHRYLGIDLNIAEQLTIFILDYLKFFNNSL